MSVMKTPRLAESSRRPGGGALTTRSTTLSPRSSPLSSRSVADVRCELRGGGMAGMDHHRNEIKKRAMLVERTPHLLRRVQEMSDKAKHMPQWVVNRCGVPNKWRQQALELVEPIHGDVIECRCELTQAWQLLQPPLDAFNLKEYEKRYDRLERVLVALERAMVSIEEKFIHGEQRAACELVQLWFRRYLTRRGFYTKRLRINRRHRGLIPGIFDSIPEKSRLTINHRTGAVTLEYPVSELGSGFMG